jgi:hypothetical protein
VTVPISTNPNPINGQAGKAVAFLSIPAANPTALGKLSPKHSTGRPPGEGPDRPNTAAAMPSIDIDTSCAVSAGRRKSNGRANEV